MIKKQNLIAFIILCIVGIAVIIIGFRCPFERTFRIPCPGCGMTRAVRSIFRLDFIGAFKSNPIVFLLPIFALEVLFDGKFFKSKKLNLALLIALVLAVIISYIFKFV